MCLVRYELGFYVSEDGILHSHRRENIKSYTVQMYSFLDIQAPQRTPDTLPHPFCNGCYIKSDQEAIYWQISLDVLLIYLTGHRACIAWICKCLLKCKLSSFVIGRGITFVLYRNGGRYSCRYLYNQQVTDSFNVSSISHYVSSKLDGNRLAY
jgi:hypothetical protein